MTDGESTVPDVGELFQLLGNDTRMRIMRALWREFSFSAYVTENREGTPFSALLEGTGIEDSGNFNYHLGKLVGVLVADRKDGYVLTPLGYNLMRSIERYTDFEYRTLEERVLPEPCPYCDGDLAGEYSRGIVSVRCRDCDGLASGGNFTFVELSAGGEDLGMATLLDAATLEMFSKVASSRYGICWHCRASIDRSFEFCGAHERGPGGSCPECDHRHRVRVEASCPHCGTSGRGPTVEYAIVSPAVATFFGDAGRGPEQVGPWRYRLAALGAVTETAAGADPPTSEVTFELDGSRCDVVVTKTDRVEVHVEHGVPSG